MIDPAPSGFLPIDPFRETILEKVKSHPVVILTAETGAGKSTRVPLWLWQRGLRVRVTQPRRIAARSLSHYLAGITKTEWGKAIGFQTGMDRRCSRDTRLLYLTDGVQMQHEVGGRMEYDVLLIDEVHEWNLNQETLVGQIRQNLDRGQYRKSGKRAVIMSATLQARQLSRFLKDAPIIEIPGRNHPVTMHRHHPDFMLSDTAQLVEAGQNLLVFLPGKKEIEDFLETLESELKEDRLRAQLLPLHAEMTIRDQARVFKHYPVPKVVAATDIAQTSLTIDDIDAVIDSGMKKEMRTRKGIEGLYPVPISRSECMQRAGRAGRVRSGQYILCADAELDERAPFPEPEIRRLNLDSVILRMIQWGVAPREFPFFHPPHGGLVSRALSRLETYGAITGDGKITRDGRKMAALPVSIRSGRMLMEAEKASPRVTQNAAMIIAIIEAGGITNRAFTGEPVYSGKFHSDLLNQLAIWKSRRQFRPIINQKKLSMATDILRELQSRLRISRTQGELTPIEESALFRAILSGFVEWVYRKSGDRYYREEEERQLDRQSALAAEKPEWITGQPFDLVVQRENAHTGEKESYQLFLITFASSFSLSQLESLSPFSYRHLRDIKLEKNALSIQHQVYFGERLIAEFAAPPNWNHPGEVSGVIPHVQRWIRKQDKDLPLNSHRSRLAMDFSRVRRVLGPDLKAFSHYWNRFLEGEIRTHLHTEHLDLHFRIPRYGADLQLHRILPETLIRRLRSKRWPLSTRIGNKSQEVIYGGSHPRVNLEPLDFENALPEEMVLPTGEPLILRMGEKDCPDWETAVRAFNDWKHQAIFEQRWKSRRRPAKMEEIADLEFPITFEGGKGKGNQSLEFHTAPCLAGDQVELIHFQNLEDARNHMEKIRPQWQERVARFRKGKLEEIFRGKGWRIKS